MCASAILCVRLRITKFEPGQQVSALEPISFETTVPGSGSSAADGEGCGDCLNRVTFSQEGR